MTNSITFVMSVAKVTISLEAGLLRKLDMMVQENVFANRSQAIQTAVQEQVARLEGNRLARECAKLEPSAEQAWADLGLASEVAEWPEY